MVWLELSTTVDSEAVEAVAELFHRFVSGGVVIEEASPPSSNERPPQREGPYHADKPVTVRAYLPQDEEAEDKRSQVEAALGHLSQMRAVAPLRTALVPETDWANAWKQHLQVLRIGRRIVVKPSWLEVQPNAGDVVIELDPGMAFGTGLHPTTRMCLEQLESLVTPHSWVLDLGTGSGILAIAAAGLGAERVLAYDVDPIAVRVAQENVARNGMASVTVAEGSIPRPCPEPATIDLVVANITAKAIIELAPAIVRALRPGGAFIAGGIIDERLDEVLVALLAGGASVERLVADGDWRTVIGRRPA